MNSSLRLMASLVVFLRQLRTPVRYVSGPYRRLQRGSPGKAKRAGAGKEISLPSTFRLKTTTAESGQPQAGNNGRQASTKRRQAPAHSRSSGSSPSQRSAHARGIARRQLAGGRRPWAAALQQGRRGGRGRRSRRRAGVVPCWTRCRAPGSARTRGCRPGLLFRRLGAAPPSRASASVSSREPGSSFPGSLMARVMAAPPGDCAHAGPVLGRSPAPTVQSISPSAPPLDCLEPSPAAPVLTGTTPDTTRRRECPARLPINCSNA